MNQPVAISRIEKNIKKHPEKNPYILSTHLTINKALVLL